MSPAATTENVSRPRSGGYGVSLDGRLFRLAVGAGRQLSIQTAPPQAPRVDTGSSSPEEATPEYGLVFARSRFSGGQGQFRAHVEGAEPTRFWDSKNVSVAPAKPGDFPEVSLLFTTASIEDISTETTPYSAYDVEGGSLYVVEGNVLRRTDDPSATSPTFSDDDPHVAEGATAVLGVTVLGDEVYAALGANGIHRKSSGTWAHYNDLQATRIWECKGRIVAAKDESIYEVTTSGVAPSPLKTLASGLRWTDVADGGDFILASATDGYVYFFATDTGSMVLATQSLFEDEQPYAVGQSQGTVLVGTRQPVTSGFIGRIYVGTIPEGGGFGESLQLIKQWGEDDVAIDASPRKIIGTRDALFTAVQDGTDTYLWRYDLTTGGLARHLTIAGTSGLVYGLHRIDGKLFATVASANVFRETSTYASEGYLIGPLGDFYSAAEKSWIGARFETGDLSSGASVSLSHATTTDALADRNSSDWTQVVSRTSGSGDPGEVALDDVVARSLAGMVVLTPTEDALTSPVVRSFSFRAYQSAGEADVIVTIPVNVSDQVERRGRHAVRVPGRGAREYAALAELEDKPVLMTLYRPDIVVRGVVEEVGTPVTAITSRGSVTMVSLVRVRGRRAANAVTTGVGAYGTFRAYAEPPSYSKVA